MKKKSEGSELLIKDDFRKTLDRRFGEFEARMDSRFDEFEDGLDRKLEEKLTKAMSTLYTRIDPILAEVEDSRVERGLMNEQLDDHEKRIKKLESN